jgi:tripartite-type tricarboxylate transporter receptor subunit TctC
METNMNHRISHAPRRGWLSSSLFATAALLGLSCVSGSLWAQAAPFPSKPVKIIVGSGPGGASDLPARALAQQLELVLKQPVLVENRPGAGTMLAARTVRAAAPDGYTFYFGNPSIFSRHLARETLDANKELTPVAEVIRGDVFVVASTGSGIDSVEKMVSHAKTSSLRCGYVSQATVMTIAMVASALPFKFDCIPYRSIDQVIQGLMSNDIQVTVSSLTPVSALVGSNKLLLVGAASKGRSSFSPKTRTLTEQGAPVVVPFRNGLWGPPGLPEEIVKVMAGAVNTVANTPAFRERMQALSNEVDVLSANAQREELVQANAFFALGAKLTGFVPE